MYVSAAQISEAAGVSVDQRKSSPHCFFRFTPLTRRHLAR